MNALTQTQLNQVSGGYASTAGDLLRGEPMPPMLFPRDRDEAI